MNDAALRALLGRVEAIAGDVGRLRRRDLGTGGYIVDRLAGNVESLDAAIFVSAGELVREGATVEEALELVDGRSRRLRRLLGERER